jgi:uncharacterized membrane protein
LIKISRTFIILVILFLLGYTSFLGGPFGLAKILFVLILIGTIIFSVFVWRLKTFSKNINIKQEAKKETIKVDVKVIE